ncbi:MAG: hypothetical protein H6Q73_887 [Firmicutes bacterium]|nr:hypothetical protein [Bacillota bacterium]
MAAHAKLSASGSKRWMSCPPSAQLEKEFPDEQSSYAAEGSFGHSLAELYLRKCFGMVSNKAFDAQIKLLKNNSFYTQELTDSIQIYVDLVIEKVNAAKAISKDAVILLEQRLDFSPWVPDGFGTGDTIIIADGLVEVIDLKLGKGVPVSAEGNTQMRLYGLGAINQFDCLYDVQAITMTIVQPRLDSVSSEELKAEELLTWGENEVKPKARLAFDGKGDFCAGDHCKFCKARFSCRARAEKNLELAAYDFQEPFLLNADEIAEILGKIDELTAWAGDLKAYALDQAENHGVNWPGWKLVEGRSNRKYTDEKKVADILVGAGYKDEVIYEKSLYGITKMTDKIGKKSFNALLAEYIIKPPGKPVLVPASDKRSAICSIASAQADFS